MKKLLIIMSLILVSCGSDEKIETNKPDWNIDENLANDFWGAVNALEEHGTNISKLQLEALEVVFVDEIKDVDSKTVAQAQKIFGDGIRIVVLKDKWEGTKFMGQLNLQNKVTMLHELGHDYFNLKHHNNGWDIMNPISDPAKIITEEEISNSINRMLTQGRKVYDSLALTKRF